MSTITSFMFVFTIVSALNFPERVWSHNLPGVQPHRCPMKCRCVAVSRTQPSGSRLLQEYAGMFNWQEGERAAVCWGRREVPTELLQEVSYLLLIGDDSRTGILDDITNPVQPDASLETDLRMGESRIKNIPPGTFENAASVIQLDLRGNKILTIEAGSFVGLEHLEILSLNANRLRALPADALQEMRNLTHLFLSGNNLRSVSGESFRNNGNLLELDLGDNLLEFLLPTSLAGLSHLRLLNLSHGRLEQIPEDLLLDLVELRKLILDDNKIENLPRQLLTKNSQLEVVSLRNNKLQRLSDVFYHQSKMLELDLSGNNLIALGDSIFSPSPALRHFDVSLNSLEKLDKETFQNCTKLSKLDASFNKLSEITAETFGELPSLQELTLARNNISQISPGSLQGLMRLETVDLTNNALRSLQARTLLGLKGLTSLRLDNNDISDIVPDAFSVGHYSMSSKLTWLYLRGNNLKRLTPYMFRGAPFVKMLNIADNKIASIDPVALSGLRSLVSLSLQGNRLGSLPEEAFSVATNIETLDLSDNSLHRVDEGAFRGLRSLVELNMADNELDETTTDWLAALSSLTQLNLNGNRFALVPSKLLISLHSLRQLSLARNILDNFRIPDHDRVGGLSRLDIAYNNLQTIEGSLQAIMGGAGSSIDLSGNPWICDCALTSEVKELTSLGAHFENENKTFCGTTPGKTSYQQNLMRVAQASEALCGFDESPRPLDAPASELRGVPRRSCKKLAAVSKANGTWPWHAIVWNAKTESALCNAALIGNDWAVTTLRCLQQIQSNLSSTMPNIFGDTVRRELDSLLMVPRGLVVRLGKSKQLFQFEPDEQAYGIMNIHIPSNDRGAGLDRPILLQLGSLATVTKAITPACVAEAPVKAQRAIALGWGVKRKQTPPNDVLQSSRMKIGPCDLSNDVIDATMLCGVRERGRPVDYSIDGNMGGALVLKRGRGDWVLLGVGTRIDLLGRNVFINLSQYSEWIYQKTTRSEDRN